MTDTERILAAIGGLKIDIEQLRQEMDAKLAALEERMDAKLAVLEERMDKRMDAKLAALRKDFMARVDDFEAREMAQEDRQLLRALQSSMEEVRADLKGLRETSASAEGLWKLRKDTAAAFIAAGKALVPTEEAASA